jgi:hypothetical protein
MLNFKTDKNIFTLTNYSTDFNNEKNKFKICFQQKPIKFSDEIQK